MSRHEWICSPSGISGCSRKRWKGNARRKFRQPGGPATATTNPATAGSQIEARQRAQQQRPAASAELRRALTPAITSPCQIPALPQFGAMWPTMAAIASALIANTPISTKRTEPDCCRPGHEEKQVCRHQPVVSVRRRQGKMEILSISSWPD